METKNIKEEIKNILEVLNEQFAIIDEHQKRIPQIELDIVMANIRHFYELFYELNKLNSSHKNSIDANIAVNFEIEKQEILSLPENKMVISDEKPDNTTISIALEPEEKKSEILKDTVIFKEEEVQETVGHESLPMEEIAEPIIEESQVQEEISASIVTETQVQEEIAEPIVAETIVQEEIREPIIAETQVQEEIAEPIVEEIVLPIVEELTIPEEIIIAETTPPVNELIITKVDVPEQKVEIELPKEVPVPMKTGKQQAIDLFSLTEKEIVADKFKETPKLMHEKMVHDKPDNTLASRVGKATITNLKNAIGINDKFLFINELFKGDLQEYNKTIDMLNSFLGIEEANVFFEDLKEKYNWNEKPDALHKLEELIIRKFL